MKGKRKTEFKVIMEYPGGVQSAESRETFIYGTRIISEAKPRRGKGRPER